MYDESVRELVIGAPWKASLIFKYLDREPAAASAIRGAQAKVVLFEPALGATESPLNFFDAIQTALRAAEATTPSAVRPLYVAFVLISDAVATGAFTRSTEHGTVPFLTTSGQAHVPFRRLEVQRGTFLGYLAGGEGGAGFFDATGLWQGASPSSTLVLDALAVMVPTR
ncbi:MAG: hypothetical protein JWO36_3956 [Myxococcales bacterium]|nr:hypothetical protein [Myxococcales bacterium]